MLGNKNVYSEGNIHQTARSLFLYESELKVNKKLDRATL